MHFDPITYSLLKDIKFKNIKFVKPGQSIQSIIDSITDASEENQYLKSHR